ncbi:peptidylprolyl isomerase [uncultured Polaribacter sp.]|uniref:peptidylprolyl isomerase n=1 Tax=uncultured Polaribacter sp. TaxID=174711 RepID=UPI002628D9EB|nr:peptidylprolyl isomerase [uncultured Polaribacter sp.]
MPQKTTTLKYIKLCTAFVFLFGIIQKANAQKVKIDGVAVVIGKNIVLDSDIEKFKLEIEKQSEGRITISDCEMLEELMQQKLLSHHAVIDSVTVSDAEVNARVDRSIQYFTQQYGSIDRVIAAYGMNDLTDLKAELYSVQKDNLLINKEQAKLTEKVDVTPEEVRLYYNGLKDKGELPEFTAEIELAHLVLKAKPTPQENKKIIDQLTEIRQEVLDGASFRLKAIINSKDPGVTQNGGKIMVTKEAGLVKEFKETSFALEKGEISKPFKSMFGYHIIMLHEIKGNTRVVSHILMQPEVPDSRLKEVQLKVEEIKRDIEAGKLTFAEAVKQYSDDEATKKSEGLIVNPYTGESKFNLVGMDPALYARVSDLKKGEISDTFYDEERSGEKMYKFLYMRERTNTHKADLVEDYVKIQDLALKKKKEETIENWAVEKIKDTYVKLGKEYKKCTFNKNWKKEVSK